MEFSSRCLSKSVFSRFFSNTTRGDSMPTSAESVFTIGMGDTHCLYYILGETSSRRIPPMVMRTQMYYYSSRSGRGKLTLFPFLPSFSINPKWEEGRRQKRESFHPFSDGDGARATRRFVSRRSNPPLFLVDSIKSNVME